MRAIWSVHRRNLKIDPDAFNLEGFRVQYAIDRFLSNGSTPFGVLNSVHRGAAAILGYAYYFNDTWRVQVDFQSGSGNSSTIGFVWSINDDCQGNPAIYVTNDTPHEVLGYVSFTYTFHAWGGRK